MTSGSYREGVMTSGSYGEGVMTSGSSGEGVMTSGGYGEGVMTPGSYIMERVAWHQVALDGCEGCFNFAAFRYPTL